jgi:hypothetical protein
MNAAQNWIRGGLDGMPHDVRLDAGGVDVRGELIRHAHERMQHAMRQLPQYGGKTVRLDALMQLHAPMSMVRLDASLGGRTNAAVFGDNTPIDRPRGKLYGQLLDAIPAITIPVGRETYNLLEGDVQGAWKPWKQGQNNDANPYTYGYQEGAQLPVHTWYADILDPDWLQTAIRGEIGIDHRSGELAGLMRGAQELQFNLLRDGITGHTGYSLASLPMARVATATAWSAGMSDATVDTCTGEVVKAIADQMIAAPIAFKPQRVLVSSTLRALLVGRTNYAGGGGVGAWQMFRMKLAAALEIGEDAITTVNFLNGIGGSGVHGIWIPMDEDGDRAGYHGRVVSLSPTIVDSFPRDGRLLTRYAFRGGANVQPVSDGALMIHVTVS